MGASKRYTDDVDARARQTTSNDAREETKSRVRSSSVSRRHLRHGDLTGERAARKGGCAAIHRRPRTRLVSRTRIFWYLYLHMYKQYTKKRHKNLHTPKQMYTVL